MKLNYSAPINSLGYGYTGYYFLRHLLKSGVDATLFEIGEMENLGGMDDIIKSSFSQKPRGINNSAPSLRIWHQNNVHPRIGRGKHYGFPIFELDKFTDMEKYSMSSCDELIVCSEWARKVLLENGINVNISVVPLGYDPEIFTPAVSTNYNTPTIFFNCGKWEYRKGHDILLQCFEAAFSENDNVELWMMCTNPFTYAKGAEWEKYYSQSKMGRKIKLIPRQRSHHDVHNIMKKVDCGVFPSRAEGWNLELLEMMACGKHNIATDYAGHTEFCNDSVRLINIDKLEKAVDNIWFHGHGEWAHIGQPQVDQIIRHMREVHSLKQNNSLGVNLSASWQANQFTWEKSTKKLINALGSP